MVSKGDDIVVYPRYVDARLSRSQGRRVAASLAVKGPDVTWLESAARKEGFSVEVEEKARDPFVPHDVVGRLLVKKEGSKEEIVRRIARRMHDAQAEREAERKR